MPAWIERLESPDLVNGESAGGFAFWPAAHPKLRVERGETTAISIRVRPAEGGTSRGYATVDQPGVIHQYSEGNDRSGLPLAPAGAVAAKIRADKSGSRFWVDIQIGPVDKAGTYRAPIALAQPATETAAKVQGLIELTLVVLDSAMVVTPQAVSAGPISISSLAPGLTQIARFGMRRLFRSFKILSINSDVSFLTFEQEAFGQGKNYLFRVEIDSGKKTAVGETDGTITIQTDDPRHERITLPVKVVLIQ